MNDVPVLLLAALTVLAVLAGAAALRPRGVSIPATDAAMMDRPAAARYEAGQAGLAQR